MPNSEQKGVPIEDMKKHIDNLHSLFNDPQTGLLTWHLMVKEELAALHPYTSIAVQS